MHLSITDWPRTAFTTTDRDRAVWGTTGLTVAGAFARVAFPAGLVGADVTAGVATPVKVVAGSGGAVTVLAGGVPTTVEVVESDTADTVSTGWADAAAVGIMQTSATIAPVT